MIPRIIHQIWLGPKKEPKEWMQAWKDKNPSFDVQVWHLEDLLPLRNQKLFDYFMDKGLYCGAADVARIEILEDLGGIYVDADLECLRSIEEAPFLEDAFFVVYDHETPGYPGRINNAIIGSMPGHPVLQEYITRMGEAQVFDPPWKTIGGKMLTDIVNDFMQEEFNDQGITILPAGMFWPENWNGKMAGQCKVVYSRHNWGTTKKAYG